MASSSLFSSKSINTSGSLNCVAPFTINSIKNNVFPLPASPQINAGRPFGKPPSVISSSPLIPVGVLGKIILLNFGFSFEIY